MGEGIIVGDARDVAEFTHAALGLIQAQHPAARGIGDDGVIVAHADVHGRRHFLRLGHPAALVLQPAHGLGHLAGLAVHRARRPVALARLVEDGAADADASVGLEAGTMRGVIVAGGLDQSQHPGLNQIVQLHARRQTGDQVLGDTLDQPGMAEHELVERVLPGVGIRELCLHCYIVSIGRAAPPTRRSAKNSRFPLAPSGSVQPSASTASCRKALAAGLLG